MASPIPPGYLRAIIPGRHPIFSGCLTTAIPPGCLSRHSTRLTSHFLWMSHSRHSTRPTSHFLWMSHIRHSTRMPQPPFHPADISFSLDVLQPPFYPADVPPSPNISHPAPDAGWERITIQLPIELTNQDVFLS